MREPRNIIAFLLGCLIVMALLGCAAPGTYEAEVCRPWDTQWNWACPQNYIVVEEEAE